MKDFIKICFLVLLLSACSDDDNPVTGPGVFVTNTADGAAIEGELFLTVGDGPFAVVVIVPGSGNDPRQFSEEFLDVFLQY